MGSEASETAWWPSLCDTSPTSVTKRLTDCGPPCLQPCSGNFCVLATMCLKVGGPLRTYCCDTLRERMTSPTRARAQASLALVWGRGVGLWGTMFRALTPLRFSFGARRRAFVSMGRNNWVSVIICHYLSLSVTICHYLSLSVTICHYLSLGDCPASKLGVGVDEYVTMSKCPLQRAFT
eukprot:COSAG05_NODE_1216_length_5489_cov_40.928386_2_plen_179_part_00